MIPGFWLLIQGPETEADWFAKITKKAYFKKKKRQGKKADYTERQQMSKDTGRLQETVLWSLKEGRVSSKLCSLCGSLF